LTTAVFLPVENSHKMTGRLHFIYVVEKKVNSKCEFIQFAKPHPPLLLFLTSSELTGQKNLLQY